MTVSVQEQKQVKLKQFLKKLSEDPSLLDQDELNEWRSLSDILSISGYQPRNEPLDMAKLLSQLLRKMGYKSSSEDMMEFVMDGGTVDEFMNTGAQYINGT